MQHQIDQSKVLKREDEMTDISKMPLNEVKPTTTQRPSSQRSTMQSVSMGEVPAGGNEENILGSVASIHDQMQPGSFMSPISDRKSGSLENLSGEALNTDSYADSTFAQKPSTSSTTGFAQKAVEKIEEFVHAAQDLAHVAADKIAEFARDLTSESSKAEAERLMQSAQSGAQDLKNEIVKKAYLIRKSVTRKLGKRGERLEKKAGLAAGVAKVYATEQLKDVSRKARRYGKELNLDSKITKRQFIKKGKGFKSQARKLQRDFESEATLAGDALRKGAFDLRRKARSMLNELPRNFKLAKDSFISEIKSELSGDFAPTQTSTGSKSEKFLVEFTSSEWNGRSGSRPETLRRGVAPKDNVESSPSKWSVEIPAHDWNESSELLAREQAGFLLNKAQDYLKRASKQYTWAQKRIQSQSNKYMRGARKYYKEAVKQGGQTGEMIKSQVNELINEATRRFGDSTTKRPNRDLKERSQGFINKASDKGCEILRDLDEVKEAAKRKLIEKKADMEFQAELLTKEKFPSQEALSKKAAVNSEIRSLHGKENTQN